ncbi:MAG TPA: F0F1 ATP synthase subunit gamma [Anaerolineae bacterium]|nr:F0F1 ATP synthase subunit gamma [Anaerolineae bacterium]
METLEALRRRIDNVQDLQSVVRTMKILAAVSIRQYEQAVQALAAYNRTIELGARILFRNPPEELVVTRAARDGRLGAVVLGSDQGMAGQFNEQIAAFALERMEEMAVPPQDRRVLVVGLRTAARLQDAGQPVEVTGTVPGSVAGITPVVQDILMQVDDWSTQGTIDRVFLFYNRPSGATAYRQQELALLPVDVDRMRALVSEPWPSPSLPTFSMEWSQLFSDLVHQYLFVSLYRALAESLTSENASRLASMQAAEKNIQEHLEELTSLFHQRRQTAITEELLDIVSGFEVLTK